MRLSLEREKNTFLLPNSITVHYTVFAIFPYFLRFCRDFAGTLTFLVRSGAFQKRQKSEIAEPTWLWQLATIRTSERLFFSSFFYVFFDFLLFFLSLSGRPLWPLLGAFCANLYWLLWAQMKPVFLSLSALERVCCDFRAPRVIFRAPFFANVSDFQSQLKAKNGRVAKTPFKDNCSSDVTAPVFQHHACFVIMLFFVSFFIRFFIVF